MLKLAALALFATMGSPAFLPAQAPPATPPSAVVQTGASADPVAASLLQVKRVYVGTLTGGATAEQIRSLIIGSLQESHLFVITENEQRADAILKGAADDKAFTDSFDSDDRINIHASAGSYGARTSSSQRSSGGYGGIAVGDHESSHTRERKHEAYAAVRLCNRDGDVIWATTQESHGAKFRGARAAVAAKIARQLQLDWDRQQNPPTPTSAATLSPVVTAKP